MSIPEGVKTNFDTFIGAVQTGRVCLIECKDSRTGQLVYCIAALCSDGTMVPFVRLHDKEDLDTLQPPNPEGGFYPPCPWEPEEDK